MHTHTHTHTHWPVLQAQVYLKVSPHREQKCGCQGGKCSISWGVVYKKHKLSFIWFVEAVVLNLGYGISDEETLGEKCEEFIKEKGLWRNKKSAQGFLQGNKGSGLQDLCTQNDIYFDWEEQKQSMLIKETCLKHNKAILFSNSLKVGLKWGMMEKYKNHCVKRSNLKGINVCGQKTRTYFLCLYVQVHF